MQIKTRESHTKGELYVSHQFKDEVCEYIQVVECEGDGHAIAEFSILQDAKLFVSAHELLRACKSALEELELLRDDGEVYPPHTIEQLKIVIRNAEAQS